MLKNMTNDYLNDLLVRLAHNSTAIEGNTLTQAETRSIILNNYIPREMNEREYYEVKNHGKAVDFLIENQNNNISSKLILKFHEILANNMQDDAGKYKKIDNLIVGANFETEKPYRVPTSIQNWCDNFNYRMSNAKTEIEKVKIILDQHIKFERIHPFSDGNGRTGRILILYSCIKENILPIIIPVEEKNRYINYLNTEDSIAFASWAIELQKKELKRLNIISNVQISSPWAKKLNEKSKTKNHER